MQARETMNCMSPYKISTENPFDPPAANLRCVATFVALSESKRPKLPRGIHWVSHSPNIWFSWRDADRKQHHVCTKSADPLEALVFKIRFLRDLKRKGEDAEWLMPALGRSPLKEVAKQYFAWKAANISPATVQREQRMFKKVLQFFNESRPVRCIGLLDIRQYQQWRRRQISPTMKQPVTARTVNYEMQLLRCVVDYADCWNGTLADRYKPLRQEKSRIGRAASTDELIRLVTTASGHDSWMVVLWCAAVAAGTGCRGCEIRKLQSKDIHIENGRITVSREIAKNRSTREPRLTALAEWGLRRLLVRAESLGATEPHHYLLPFEVAKSRHLAKARQGRWDVNRPMKTWMKSWRKLVQAAGIGHFRFHDLRHTFRTQGAEAGVPLEIMMAQIGHIDRESSLEYVHIQQRGFDQIKRLIGRKQAAVLAVAQRRSTHAE